MTDQEIYEETLREWEQAMEKITCLHESKYGELIAILDRRKEGDTPTRFTLNFCRSLDRKYKQFKEDIIRSELMGLQTYKLKTARLRTDIEIKKEQANDLIKTHILQMDHVEKGYPIIIDSYSLVCFSNGQGDHL